MKTKLLLIAVLLPLAFSACKKDDPVPTFVFPEGKVPDEAVVYTGTGGLLPARWVRTVERKIGEYITVDKEITDFEYDGKNRITAIFWRRELNVTPESPGYTPAETPGPKTQQIRFVYNGKGYLVREENSYDMHPERTVYYAYENGEVFSKDVVYGFDPQEYITKMTFDAEGRIVRKTDPTGLHYKAFVYDDRGNATEYRDIIGGDSGWRYSHTYDDRKGAFCRVNTPAWWLSSNGYYGWLNHNKITEDNREQTPNRIEYRYNEQGYPVSYRYIDKTYSADEEFTIEYIDAAIF